MHSTSKLNDGYLGSGKRLKYSIKKYGKDSHIFEILEFLPDRKSLADREREMVNSQLLSDPLCMNLVKGGEGWYGFQNKEHQTKCSAVGSKRLQEKLKTDPAFHEVMSKKWSDGNKKAIERGVHKNWKTNNVSWVGKHHSEQTIAKMKEKKVGHGVGMKNSQFGTRWMIHPQHGTIKVSNCEVSTYLSSGYVFGRTKKSISLCV